MPPPSTTDLAMSNQKPAVASNPQPCAIRAPSTEASVNSLKPVAVSQLHVDIAVEAVKMSGLLPAHLNLRPCPYSAAAQEKGQNDLTIHTHFLLDAQHGTGSYILKLTKCGQCTDVSDIHLSTHRPMIRKERPQVFKTIGDQQLFARQLECRQSRGLSSQHGRRLCCINENATNQ
eukprot:26181-Chlamydomonas_euryale.AAC.5